MCSLTQINRMFTLTQINVFTLIQIYGMFTQIYGMFTLTQINVFTLTGLWNVHTDRNEWCVHSDRVWSNTENQLVCTELCKMFTLTNSSLTTENKWCRGQESSGMNDA